MLLGFLDPGHVRSFTLGFAESNVPVDLVPVSSGLPPTNRSPAVELRIAPGLSWFFELRQPDPARLGDNDTTTFAAGGEIVGYDTVAYRKPPVVAEKRRQIILLLDDGDGQGPILTVAEDYESLDAVDPANIQRFSLEVVWIAPGLARVRVNVGRVDQPDLPWSTTTGPRGDYKSPDIEIRTPLSDVSPLFLNMPILDLPNRVVARVRTMAACRLPDVSVRFAVLPVSTDDAESARWQPLPGWTPPVPPCRTWCTTFPPAARRSSSRSSGRRPRTGTTASRPGSIATSGCSSARPPTNRTSTTTWPSRTTSVLLQAGLPGQPRVVVDRRAQPDRSRSGRLDRTGAGLGAVPPYVPTTAGCAGARPTRSVRLEVESKATSIWDAIESRWPDGRTWLRSWLPGEGCTAKTGTGVTIGTATAVASRLRVLEQGPGFTLLRVEGPEGAPPLPRRARWPPWSSTRTAAPRPCPPTWTPTATPSCTRAAPVGPSAGLLLGRAGIRAGRALGVRGQGDGVEAPGPEQRHATPTTNST